MNNFPSRLRELMHDQKLTQQALAEKASTSQTSVMRWLSGAARPHPRALAELAVALGVRPAWLAEGTEPRDLSYAMRKGKRIDDSTLREESPRYAQTNGRSSSSLALLEDKELWELVEGLPHMIASATNDTVRQRLASDAEQAAHELRERTNR